VCVYVFNVSKRKSLNISGYKLKFTDLSIYFMYHMHINNN